MMYAFDKSLPFIFYTHLVILCFNPNHVKRKGKRSGGDGDEKNVLSKNVEFCNKHPTTGCSSKIQAHFILFPPTFLFAFFTTYSIYSFFSKLGKKIAKI